MLGFGGSAVSERGRRGMRMSREQEGEKRGNEVAALLLNWSYKTTMKMEDVFFLSHAVEKRMNPRQHERETN